MLARMKKMVERKRWKENKRSNHKMNALHLCAWIFATYRMPVFMFKHVNHSIWIYFVWCSFRTNTNKGDSIHFIRTFFAAVNCASGLSLDSQMKNTDDFFFLFWFNRIDCSFSWVLKNSSVCQFNERFIQNVTNGRLFPLLFDRNDSKSNFECNPLILLKFKGNLWFSEEKSGDYSKFNRNFHVQAYKCKCSFTSNMRKQPFRLGSEQKI